MLTDLTLEEEFEIKVEEPWYEKQDLEHDLHLAAELGKTLLERNRELEQGLKQMYSTNQEQLQEIEYLTKQVELLRQVNDQHAKVHEQLDQSSREMEQTNYRLILDSRVSQQTIQGLNETIETLQTQVEELQQQASENLKASVPQPSRKPHSSNSEVWWPRGAQSLSSLKELPRTHRYSDSYDPEDPSDELFLTSDLSWQEVEQASLRQSLRSLQNQLANERTKREQVEHEADMLANENAALEQRLGAMKGCQARLVELETEAEELRQLWRANYVSKGHRSKVMTPDVMFFPADDELATEVDDEGELPELLSGDHRGSEAGSLDHERSCARRSQFMKHRGISLLNEVDAQYSALQVKYDELLSRCHQGVPVQDQGEPTHKAVQTLIEISVTCQTSLSHSQVVATEVEDSFQQPEYKSLFKEIFTCIQKTKEDLSENRGDSLLVE